MSLFLRDADFTLYQGDALAVLRDLPAESVHMCVTSPPFYGLRDYGTGEWEGGSGDCDHRPNWQSVYKAAVAASTLGGGKATQADAEKGRRTGSVCKCGARRVDQQIGLEETPDAYVARLVDVFREVRRVLRSDGTCWVEIGDSYNSPGSSGYAYCDLGGLAGASSKRYHATMAQGSGTKAKKNVRGYKQKDLLGVPWLLAFALRADGWYLRSEIIWAKPNPMPESVTDRPTTSHSRVFLLAKSARYFYDAEAVREPADFSRPQPSAEDKTISPNGETPWLNNRYAPGASGYGYNPAGRNRRSVWTIATQPLADEHYAAFPEKLVEPMILAGSPEGGTVLDPFVGSGTTALVARKHGRRTIGIELNPTYCAMAARRLSQLSLLATEGTRD